jgi:hypothetical protein
MKQHPVLLFVLIAFLVGSVVTSSAAAKKPKKPTNKLSAIGTSQLPGEWCQFAKAYTLGTRAAGNAMNVTLKSAEYTISQIKVGSSVFRPQEGEKFLVIHYTLHNPLPQEQGVGYATITWTAVDAAGKDRNQEYLGVGVEDAKHSQLDQVLKPAQKIEVFAIIRVDGYGPVPKLMAARYEVTKPVARYDLKGKVTALPLPYSDPTDTTGATMLKQIPGVVGQSYITGDFETKVDKVEFVDPPLADEGYDIGTVYALITLECKYWGDSSGGIGGSASPTSGFEIKDADGASYTNWNGPLSTSSYRSIDARAGNGEAFRCRLAVAVPKGVQLKTLKLKEYSGYPVLIDVSAFKAP